MIENLNHFAIEFLLSTGYCLLVSALVYGSSKIMSSYYLSLQAWREFWIVAFICCVLPLFYGLMPETEFELAYFPLLEVNMPLAPDLSGGLVESQEIINPTDYPLSWLNIVALSWLIIFSLGLVIKLIGFYLSWQKIRHLISHARPIQRCNFIGESAAKQQIYIKLLRLQQIFKVKILVTKQAVSPFVIQLPTPALIISRMTFDELSAAQFNLILRHELTHLKRYDGILTLIIQLSRCVIWFNPFALLSIQKLNLAIEASCDATVLNRQPYLRRTYAQAMLKILRRSATENSNNLVAAFSLKLHRSITMRITHIMNPSLKGIKSVKTNVCLLGGAFGLCFASFSFHPSLNAAESVTSISAKSNNISMLNPVSQARVSSNYGASNKFHQFHRGIDLAAKMNTPVIAAEAGVVIESTDLLDGHKNYGKIIIIEHANGLQSLYSHLNDRSVNIGDKVQAGQLIGKVGETGKATGPHLHLEIKSNNESVNPNDFIQFDA